MSNKTTGTPARLSGEQITLFEAIALIAFGDPNRSLPGPPEPAKILEMIDQETGEIAASRKAEALLLFRAYEDERAAHHAQVTAAARHLGAAIKAGTVPARGERLHDGIRFSSSGTTFENPIPVPACKECGVVFDELRDVASDGGRIRFLTGTDSGGNDVEIAYRDVHVLRASVEKLASKFSRRTVATDGIADTQHSSGGPLPLPEVINRLVAIAKSYFDKADKKPTEKILRDQFCDALIAEFGAQGAKEKYNYRRFTEAFRSDPMAAYRRGRGYSH